MNDIYTCTAVALARILKAFEKFDHELHDGVSDEEAIAYDIQWPKLPVVQDGDEVVGHLVSDDLGVWYFEPVKETS